MDLPQAILTNANSWANDPEFDDQTRQEIRALIDTKNSKELIDRFYRDLEFGTGGIRGLLGAGTYRINFYTIRKASTALALYLKKVFPSESLSVAVTFDSRHFSQEFAHATCEVLAHHGIRTILTSQMRPVPFLSFMVRHFGAHAGVCITASHNPSSYNGFKVYWHSGGQLVPPHDEGITEIFKELRAFKNLDYLPIKTARSQGLVREVLEELDEAYFKKLEKLSLFKGHKTNLKIVYTPLHGTGVFVVPNALKLFGFSQVSVVEAQSKPDGNFPTVKSPNPEERSALDLALQEAKARNADLVLGTDPDSDRVGIVVREGDEWTFFNGNQLGCLLYEFVLSQSQLPKSGLTIKTVVTTELQREISEYYGVDCEETLTGFKWICDLVDAYETGARKPFKKFICGGEESYGFLADTFVRDKDAVMTCAIAADMLAHYKSQGLSLTQVLDQLFKRHQLYWESLYTLTLTGKEGAEKIKSIMMLFRENPPTHIRGLKVERVNDFLVQKTLEIASMKKSLLAFPKTDLLQFYLEDGTKLSIRPSGTEPKIKIYVSAKEKVGVDLNMQKKKIQEKLVSLEKSLVGLIAKS